MSCNDNWNSLYRLMIRSSLWWVFSTIHVKLGICIPYFVSNFIFKTRKLIKLIDNEMLNVKRVKKEKGERLEVETKMWNFRNVNI